MKINIGSKAPPKVDALKEIANEYDILKNAEVVSVEVNSGVGDQPVGFEELVQGAKNRAKNAFKDCELSFGLESGIVPVPHTKSDYMDFCCCAIFDGKDFFVGSSPCFEYPKKVIDMIFNEGKEVSKIFNEMGWGDEGFHQREGAIGVLTKGVITREKYSESSVIMALTRFLNKELYK